MNHWLDNSWQRLPLSDSLKRAGVDLLFRGWRTPASLIGKLCTGAERWQAAVREIQPPSNLADILRAKPVP